MNDEQVWNDDTRDRLRKKLRSIIVGELRLARREQEQILEICRETYIQEECPAGERDKFIHFATDQINRASAQLASEKVAWPNETDCDRLDRVEAALRERGILLWQVSPCCDTCTWGELPDRTEVIDSRYPGFRESFRGYAFFIDQNMPEMLADDTHVLVFLGYGWCSPDNSKVVPQVYEKNALGIAREVCECLLNEGFEPDWNGSFSQKVGVSLNWQRREILD